MINMEDLISISNITLFLQTYIRYILGVIILSNFGLIFTLKFFIQKKQKLKRFIDENKILLKNLNKSGKFTNEKDKFDNKTSNDNKKDTNNSEEVNDNLHSTNELEKHILFVIAHPDDDIMFFYPTIKNLLKTSAKINFLCLTNGNFDGLGKIREIEFDEVMKNLGITDYEILNNQYNDNMKEYYNSDNVSKSIEEYLVKNKIQIYSGKLSSIITFDEKGVTNHPNHISCCNGVM